MQYTEHYNLNKPDGSDIADVPAHFSSNMDIIDTQLKENAEAITGLAGEGRTAETVKGAYDALKGHEAAVDPHDQYALDTDLAGLQVEVEAHLAENAANMQKNNILHNGDFKINQRGQSSYSGSVYGLDRWKGANSVTVEPKSYGVLLTCTEGQYSNILQYIEFPERLSGKTVTLSFDGEYAGSNNGILTLVQDRGGTQTILLTGYITSAGRAPLTAVLPEILSTDKLFVKIQANTSGTIAIRKIKLEFGSVSTLANDTTDYAEELAKCQRYYLKTGGMLLGRTASAVVYFLIPTPTTMRTTPTVIMTTAPNIVEVGGGYKALSSITAISLKPIGIDITGSVEAAFTNAGPVAVTSGTFEISADL